MEHSPFGKLPSEVRNMIYALTLTRDRPLKMIARYCEEEHDSEEATQRKHLGALRNTCKEIKGECNKLFYVTNNFTMRPGEAPIVDLRTALTSFNTTLQDYKIQILRPVLIDLGATNASLSFTLVREFQVSMVATLKLLRSLKHSQCYRILITVTTSAGLEPWRFEVAVQGVYSALKLLVEKLFDEYEKLSFNVSGSEAVSKVNLGFFSRMLRTIADAEMIASNSRGDYYTTRSE